MLLQPLPAGASPMLLADRYLQTSTCWFDIATGAVVQVVVRRSGRRREQIEWADRCSMLSRLRHPLISPLIDYGAASSSALFEVYAAAGALVAPRTSASHLVTHATRFLSAHGIQVETDCAAYLLRAINPVAGAAREKPVGVVLQARRADGVVAEVMSAPRDAGTLAVDLAGEPGMGLRTAWLETARRARVDGYVPLSPAALRRWPELEPHVERRHVCLLIWDAAPAAERQAAARFLARLAQRTARPHLCIVARRGRASGAGVIHLEALGRNAMTSMVYVDPEYGPSETQILEAARRAEGSPGRMVQCLAGVPASGGGVTIHETPAPYGPDRERLEVRGTTPGGREHRSRIDSVLWRAGSRAAALNARGRHAAARRLLGRAARALTARGDAAQAARCWIQLGWLLRGRGAITEAHDCGTRAGDVAIDEDRFHAGLLRAACWIDEAKFADAEAALRTLLVGASTAERTTLTHICRTELARVMARDGRLEQASATLGDLFTSSDLIVSCAASIVRSSILLASRDVAGAMRAARLALARAAATDDQRSIARAYRAIAACSCAAGDVDQVREHVRHGIAAASAARLPLAALRLRGILLRALDSMSPAALETHRLRATLTRALRRPLPALVRNELRAAVEPQSTASLFMAPVSPIETFIRLAQKASDDVGAVVSVAAAMLESVEGNACVIVGRDGRTLVAAGRPWRESSPAVAQVLASGQGIAPDRQQQPPEAAEPVRWGGELLGAIGCRWIAGSSPVPRLVTEVLRGAALCLGTHLRSLVETAAAPTPTGWSDLLGETGPAVALREAVHRAALAPFPVLIEGESGSGKELVARAIHRLSPRHGRRFCAINCAALGDELVEAELFGHTRGAFTGAVTERAGLFEEADGGTLFLDEIGELSPRAQAKLLRVLQEGEVRRVGENLPRRVDVRIVAATNRSLAREAAEGRFRVDLRFRLDVLRIDVPTLRERAEDVPLLAQHFWRAAAARVGSHATLGPDALAALSRYEWPGNVRELQNAIAWLAVHAPRRGRVGASLIPAQLANAPMATGSSFEAAREDFERRYVRAALIRAGGQRQEAARALGMSRQGFSKMLRRLRIEGPRPPDGGRRG